jgi:competence protein ComEC
MNIKSLKKSKYHSWCILLTFILVMMTACSEQTITSFKRSESSITEVSTDRNSVSLASGNSVGGQLKVHFIDVGQADSILLQHDNSFMLVDAGNNGDANLVRSYLERQGVKELQVFIGTHKDEDHIGSADYIINSFNIGKVYFPKQTATTKTFEDFINAVKNKGLKLTVPRVSESFKLGEALVTVLAPNGTVYEDANDYSIVIRVDFGNTSFLFTGDAEAKSETEMLSKGVNLEATVLKVGHHGSSSSTSKNFLDKVNPKYAVISVGKDNSYGHPSDGVIQRLKSKNIPIYRTDQSGTIIATSDGKEVRFNIK